MSFYASIEAHLTFNTQADFDTAVKTLTEGGWMKDGHLLTETGEILSEEPDINEATKELRIPCFHYRNLSRLLDELTKNSTGWAIWTSTDGCFDAGLYQDGKETTYDLSDWAKKNPDLFDDDDAVEPPQEDFEDWCEWAANVEQIFFENMLEEVN